MLNLRTGLVALALVTFGCAPVGGAEAEAPGTAQAETFQYAPVVGTVFQHVQERLDEVEIIGAPYRESEYWRITWTVEVKKESNLYVHSHRLESLVIAINGKQILQGSEVHSIKATMDILTDSSANIADIRGTEQLTEALLAVTPEEQRPQVAAVFSPDQLKGLYIARVHERVADVIGRPASVGSKWLVNGADPATPVKEVLVARAEPCGAASCRVLERSFQIDKNVVQAMAAHLVVARVQAEGGDPANIQYVHGDAELEDRLLVDPATMAYHGAIFSEKARLSAGGPKGQLDVQVTRLRKSSYKY